jgi:hypothetical protein
MNRFDLIGGGLWFVFSLLIMVESLRLGLGSINSPGAGLFPFMTSLLLAVLSLLMLSECKKKSKIQWAVSVWSGETNWRNLVLVLLSMTIYGLVINYLGFLLSTFLLLLFLFRVIVLHSWAVSLIGSLVTIALSYLVFNSWLQCQLPDCLLLEKLMRIR